MKYAIITPTFKPHFQYVDKYLMSYNRFVVDKERNEIIFTILKDEDVAFRKILQKYPNVKYKTVYFEDLLQKFYISYSPAQLLRKYEKYTYQTLKKFYTMLDFDADYFLVLDSESMWIRKTSMAEMFEQYYKNPFITHSSLSDRNYIRPFTKHVIENTNYLLNKDCDKWFLENFVWFYDKKILNNLFNDIGSPIQLADKIHELNDTAKKNAGIFEITLYQNYLYNNNEKYHYKLLNADKFLDTMNETQKQQYINDYYKLCHGNCGILEHTMMLLTEDNCEPLAKEFKKNNFNIIRCNSTNIDNYGLQKFFLKIVQPNILAASQNHAFGINNSKIILLKQNKYIIKLSKHIKRLFEFLSYLLKPFSILLYVIKFLFNLPQFYKKYNKEFSAKKRE